MSSNLPALATSQLPAYLMEAMKQPSQVMSDALTGLLSGGALRLVANQGRFRIKDGSTETVLNELSLDVIIVGAVPGVTKSFYLKAYNPKDDAEQKQPDCASLYGDVPDADSPNKQATSCAACPKNQWGSKVTEGGSEIKACSDYRRVALVSVDDPETLYQANIPPASISKLWKPYLKELAMRGVDISMVKTRISLDDHQWVFQFAGFIDAEQFAATRAIPKAAITEVLGLTGRPAPAALPAPAAPAAAAPAPTPTPAPAAAPAPAPEAPARGFGKKKAATAATATPAAATATVSVAPAGSAIDALSAELGALIGGAPDV